MSFLDVVFPKRCLGCGRVGKYFCDECRKHIRIIEANEAICPICEKPAIDGKTHPRCQTRYTPDRLTSFFRYNGIIRKAVKAVKYRLISDLVSEFVALIPPASFCEVTKLQRSNAMFLPIPLHVTRFKERGFNQAELFGGALCQKLRIPMRVDILKRTRKTKPQVEMETRKMRLTNMDHVFSIDEQAINPWVDKTIVLLDDVFTTGATMRQAANVLKRAGVGYVWAVTIAR